MLVLLTKYIIKINFSCFILPFSIWLLENFKLDTAPVLFLLARARRGLQAGPLLSPTRRGSLTS